MTVPNENSRSGPHFGNGVTTVFNYGFRVVDESHLSVIHRTLAGVETILVLHADYEVLGVGNVSGQVVTSVAPIAGETITILRNVPFTQETDLENNGPYYAETVERAFDVATMRDQQLKENLSRALVAPPSYDPSDVDGLVGRLLQMGEIYLGASAADPVARNDGSPLQAGDLYFNTTSSLMKVRTANGEWGDATTVSLNMASDAFEGDGAEDEFQLSVEPGVAANVIVWVDGVRLTPIEDYSVDGDVVRLNAPPTLGAEIRALTVATVSKINVPVDESVKRSTLSINLSKSVPVSAGEYGAILDGSSGDLVKVRDAWMSAVDDNRPFIVPQMPEPLTIQVSEDFANLQDAHNATLGWLFSGPPPKYADDTTPLNHVPQYALQFDVADTEFVSSGRGIVWNHPFGQLIKVKGRNTVGLAFDSLQAQTYSGGVHLVRLRFTTWPTVPPVAGQTLRIVAPVGTGEYLALEGGWRIHSVNSANKDITIAVHYRQKTSPLALTLTSGVFVYIPTLLRFTNLPYSGADVGGIDVHTWLNIEDVAISGSSSGTNDSATGGIILRQGSNLKTDQHVSVLEWPRFGLWALDRSRADIAYASFCACGTNINAITGSFVGGIRVAAQGGVNNNVVINTGARGSLTLGAFGGGLNGGIRVYPGGYLVTSGHCIANDIGVDAAGGHIDINNMTVVDNVTENVRHSARGGKAVATTWDNIGPTAQTPGFTDPAGGFIGVAASPAIPTVIGGNFTWNPASIASGAQLASSAQTVTGATVAMSVDVTTNINMQGLKIWGGITGTNTLVVYLFNGTGSAVDLGNMTIYYKITSFF